MEEEENKVYLQFNEYIWGRKDRREAITLKWRDQSYLPGTFKV